MFSNSNPAYGALEPQLAGPEGSTELINELRRDMRGSKMFYRFSFLFGIIAMGIAGYFLIIGLSKFGGDETTQRILIVGAILFQVIESYCFVASTGYSYHSKFWKTTLFGLGVTLFFFSLLVMTLAQKTALQASETQANAIDAKIALITQQISSYDELINSYRFNAEKQSKSIYKDSRKAGQDALNKAAELEEKKIALSDELFNLKNSRKQTAMDFFKQLGEMTGFNPTDLEWYFLIGRAILFELCGIILLSFGVTLKGKHMKKYFEYFDSVSVKQKDGEYKNPVPSTIVQNENVPPSTGTGYNQDDSTNSSTENIPENVSNSTISGNENVPAKVIPKSDTVKRSDLAQNARQNAPFTTEIEENTNSRKKGQENCKDQNCTETSTKSPGTILPAGTISEQKNVPSNTGTEYSQDQNVVHLDQAKKKQMVLDKLTPEIQQLVEKALSAFQHNGIKKLTREEIRIAFKISSEKAGIVAKAAKSITKTQQAAHK